MTYTVIVGNIGTVHTGTSRKVADREYNAYVRLSRQNVGRAGGEQVTLLADDEPVREYVGNLRQDI